MEEKKKRRTSSIYFLVMILLIIVVGVYSYLNLEQRKEEQNQTESTQLSTNTEGNSKSTISGIYTYVVPEEIVEDLGLYYQDVNFKFSDDNTFIAEFSEGFGIKGKYTRVDNIITCEVENLRGIHFDYITVENVKYVFELENESTIMLKEKIGTMSFIDTEGNDRKMTTEKYEEINSKYILD